MYNRIAIFNEKGGVGKTTFSTQISILLSRSGFRTLLLDLDSQGDSTSYFQLEDKIIEESSLYNILYNKIKIEDLVHKINDNLSLISNTHFEEINTFLGTKPKGYFNKIFEDIEKNYDFIIMDCSPTRNNINEKIMHYATHINLITIPEYLSFKAIFNVYKYMNNELKEDKIKNIIINKVKSNNEHKEIIKMIEDIFKNKNIFKFKDKIGVASSSHNLQTFFDIKDQDLQFEMSRLITTTVEQWKEL